MGRYIGPKNKVARRFKTSIFNKNFERKKRAGRVFLKRISKKTEYGKLLMSRKEATLTYNIRERMLRTLLKKASLKKEDSVDVLVSYLELRLDNVVFRLRFGKTRGQCRQLVSHKHICVNDEPVDIASRILKVGDTITYSARASKNNNICRDFTEEISVCRWLNFDKENKKGTIIDIPKREDVTEKIKFTDIIEIYSR